MVAVLHALRHQALCGWQRRSAASASECFRCVAARRSAARCVAGTLRPRAYAALLAAAAASGAAAAPCAASAAAAAAASASAFFFAPKIASQFAAAACHVIKMTRQ